GTKAGGMNLNHNQTPAGLRVKTIIKAGIVRVPISNHNQNLAQGLKLQTSQGCAGRVNPFTTASGMNLNHNQTLAPGLKLRTSVRAGVGMCGYGKGSAGPIHL